MAKMQPHAKTALYVQLPQPVCLSLSLSLYVFVYVNVYGVSVCVSLGVCRRELCAIEVAFGGAHLNS